MVLFQMLKARFIGGWLGCTLACETRISEDIFLNILISYHLFMTNGIRVLSVTLSVIIVFDVSYPHHVVIITHNLTLSSLNLIIMIVLNLKKD